LEEMSLEDKKTGRQVPFDCFVKKPLTLPPIVISQERWIAEERVAVYLEYDFQKPFEPFLEQVRARANDFYGDATTIHDKVVTASEKYKDSASEMYVDFVDKSLCEISTFICE